MKLASGRDKKTRMSNRCVIDHQTIKATFLRYTVKNYKTERLDIETIVSYKGIEFNS